MQVRVEKITPKKAQEWIDRSHDVSQRSLNKVRVERLAHAIRDGQWRVTHQAIAIDETGRVLDGQHRLHAIVLAGQDMPGLEVEALVAFDADPSSFDVIDTGAVRTTSDTLKIAGFTNTNVLAASIRSYLTYDDVVNTTRDWSRVAARLTTADVLEWIEVKANKDRARAALAIGARVSTSVGRHGLNTSITAAALIMMQPRKSAVTYDTMLEFYERLSDGAMLASHSPILALRRWMIGDTGFGRIVPSHRRPTAVACQIKAMNDYLVGRERSVTSFKIGIEPMPALLSKKEVEEISLARERALQEREKVDA